MQARFALIFFITLTYSNLFCQSLEELDRRNGFQDIKMTAAISDYEGLEYQKDIDHEVFPGAKRYTAIKGFYDKIGTIKVYDVEVDTYKDSIYQIKVVADKDPNLYKGLKRIYGEPEYAYRKGVYKWTAKNLSLSYTSHSKHRIEMTYFSHLMVDKIKEDKEKVVESIADDF